MTSSGYEILTCERCGYMGKPRPSTGRWVMPCSECGSIELQISDLVLTNTRPVRSRARPEPPAPFDRVLELRGGALHDTCAGGSDPDGAGPRLGDRPAPAAPAPALAGDLDPEISIDPLLEP